MIQEQIYKKDINRIIDGVIKADSTAKLAEEITEFVITGEQIRLLPRLFDTLVPGSKANCVWISGDFGSGKSHLLKILSYVLENKHNLYPPASTVLKLHTSIHVRLAFEQASLHSANPLYLLCHTLVRL